MADPPLPRALTSRRSAQAQAPVQGAKRQKEKSITEEGSRRKSRKLPWGSGGQYSSQAVVFAWMSSLEADGHAEDEDITTDRPASEQKAGEEEEKKPDPQRPSLGLRVVCVSDTHGRHRNVVVPDGDVLIHAGDSPRESLTPCA